MIDEFFECRKAKIINIGWELLEIFTSKQHHRRWKIFDLFLFLPRFFRSRENRWFFSFRNSLGILIWERKLISIWNTDVIFQSNRQCLDLKFKVPSSIPSWTIFEITIDGSCCDQNMLIRIRLYLFYVWLNTLLVVLMWNIRFELKQNRFY